MTFRLKSADFTRECRELSLKQCGHRCFDAHLGPNLRKAKYSRNRITAELDEVVRVDDVGHIEYVHPDSFHIVRSCRCHGACLVLGRPLDLFDNKSFDEPLRAV